MRFAIVAVLGAFIALPADAVQQPHQNVLSSVACDNDGRCSALNANAAVSDNLKSRPEITVEQRSRALDANGNRADGIVISHKTGARARVGVKYAARFQAYIDDLENTHGARVLFMGGIRPGKCSSSSEHPCGKALDVCQRRRGVVDPRCNLPGRVALGQIAAAYGLFEGGRWCNSDYGHAQVDVTAAACGNHHIRIVQQDKQVPAFGSTQAEIIQPPAPTAMAHLTPQ